MTLPGVREREGDLVDVDGRRMRVRVEGEGPPLLLLNGLTRPLESWETVTRALTGRTVVRFDAPGVGSSPTPRLPLSMSALARLAVSVLDAVGLDDADVLGFSYGGAVAQQLAVDAPERVRRLVLVSTSCGIGATPADQGALRGLLPRPAAHPWPWPDSVGTLWRILAISCWSSIPFLGAIRVPTIVVCGARDRMVPATNSALLARRIPGARLVVLPAGHDLQRAGQAGSLVEIVEPFLAGRVLREPRLVSA
ncbi:MAG: alpha/beta hydrolase [Actinomycetota bacterium]|nr:alpha/beta hydrolase [Actinomycetota bacterium]